MIRIPLNSSALRFAFTPEGIDLTNASTYKLKFRKPDETEGQWDATYDGTYIIKEFSVISPGISELDMIGFWKAWVKVIFLDGREIEMVNEFDFEVFMH